MRLRRLLIATALSLLAAAPASAIGVVQGYVERGGSTVLSSILGSTIKAQRSYPAATITVYTTTAGAACTSTLAVIYSDLSLTPLSNPFAAQSDGYYKLYTNEQQVCMTFSGGGISAPFTRSYITTTVLGLTFITQADADALYPRKAGTESITGTWTFSQNNVHTGHESFTSATASPLLIKPSSSPAANTKLFDLQATGGGGTLFSIDAEGDAIANSITDGASTYTIIPKSATFYHVTNTGSAYTDFYVSGGSQSSAYDGTAIVGVVDSLDSAHYKGWTLTSSNNAPAVPRDHVFGLNYVSKTGLSEVITNILTIDPSSFRTTFAGGPTTFSQAATFNYADAGNGPAIIVTSALATPGNFIALTNTNAGGQAQLQITSSNATPAANILIGNNAGTATWNEGMNYGSNWTLKDANAGTVRLTADKTTGNITINDGLQLTAGAAAEPACAAGNRGVLWYTKSGAGVADYVRICGKNAANAYAWQLLLTF